MKVGEKVRRTPKTFMDCGADGKLQRRQLTGTVVYVHPAGRYHTVAFETRGGLIRECFAGAK